ncbi:MAG: anthranilate synthase component I, partial [Eubacterium sp.]|nr:anthranilate synthase component I [Eubacterium sp.]
MQPTMEEVMQYSKDYNIVPIQEEIYADVVTPISLLRKIAATKKNYYLLESIEGGEKWGRYSFLGYDPIMRVTCQEKQVTIQKGEIKECIHTEDAFSVIREILQDYKAPKVEGMPPFAGGFVGYFAYAMIAHAEPKLSIQRDEFADYDLMLFDKVIAYDHLKQKIVVVANVRVEDHVQENYAKAKADIKGIIALIRDNTPIPDEPVYDKVNFKC